MVGALLVFVAMLVAPLALADEHLDPELARQGWFELRFDDKFPNTWRWRDTGIEVISDNSVSVLYKDLSEPAGRCLSWVWKVTEATPPTDLSRKGEDDRSLAVYVSFPYQPDEASLWEKLRRPFVETAKGEDAPGRVLSYVWGGRGQRGDAILSPYLGKAGMLVILRDADAPLDRWVHEVVNLERDYRRAFGHEAPLPSQLAISADSDDTGTRAAGVVHGLALSPCANLGSAQAQ